MFFKKVVLLFFLISNAFGFSQDKVNIIIENNLDFDRNEKVISIDWNIIKNNFKTLDTLKLIVIDNKTKKQVPYQFEHKGKKEIQNLLILIDCKAKASTKLIITKGKKENFETKTYGRFVPERKDDFAWENDKIAFRAYGKTLENTKENAYGFDVWVKSTDKMVINDRYEKGNYHVDQGNGMDYYHVGLTLGAGNMAPYYKDSIIYPSNYKEWKVLDNGPLRTTFKLDFDEWQVGNLKVKQSKIISIDAGSQLSKIKNQYNYNSNENIEAVIGVIKRKENDVSLLDEQKGIIGYWEPTHQKYGTTGIGIIVPKKVDTIFEKYEQILAKITLSSKESFSYYTGACWDKKGEFTSAEEWFQYLYRFAKEIEQPLIIKIQ